MLTDPLSVTYNSVAKSLVRTSTERDATFYKTADGEFTVKIVSSSEGPETTVSIELSRIQPDPTPTNAFDAFRVIRNTFGMTYRFDVTNAGTSVDIPLLRTALLAFVDATLQGRLISGEK